jgi:hypothetical protein
MNRFDCFDDETPCIRPSHAGLSGESGDVVDILKARFGSFHEATLRYIADPIFCDSFLTEVVLITGRISVSESDVQEDECN